MSGEREKDQTPKSGEGITEKWTKREKVSKRRVYLVNKQFQLQWLTELLLLCVCFMVLTAITCFAYYTYLVPDSMDEIGQKLLLNSLLVGYLAGVGVLVYSVVRLSHRTAGPMYHFNRIFKEIGKGNLAARVHLRKLDHWREMAQSFNDAMDGVQDRRKNLEEALSDLATAARSASESGAGGKDLAAAVEKASALIAQDNETT